MLFLLHQFSGDNTITANITLIDEHLVVNWQVDNQQPLKWPPCSRPHRDHGLWQSTCFELFIREPDSRRYLELNVTPGSAWNCYEFEDYRKGMRDSDTVTVQSVIVEAHNLTVRFACGDLLDIPRWLLGVTAVLETEDGELQYYAPAHRGKPDFHDPSHHVLVSLNDL